MNYCHLCWMIQSSRDYMIQIWILQIYIYCIILSHHCLMMLEYLASWQIPLVFVWSCSHCGWNCNYLHDYRLISPWFLAYNPCDGWRLIVRMLPFKRWIVYPYWGAVINPLIGMNISFIQNGIPSNVGMTIRHIAWFDQRHI